MTQRSMVWDGTTVGDATLAPYDAPNEQAEIWRALVQAAQFTARSIVFPRQLNELGYTIGVANINISSGRALVHGTWYEADAAESVSIPTPAALTRVDLIVLRKTWATQEVRLFRIAGTEGAGRPPIVQTAGVTWDAVLFEVQVTTGGVITILTDERNFGFDLVPPYVSVGRTANQTIATASDTPIQFDNMIYRSDATMWDSGANTRLVAVRQGIYRINIFAIFAAAATGIRQIRVVQNGATTIGFDSGLGSASLASMLKINTEALLTPGDYIEVYALQNSGGNVDLSQFSYAPKAIMEYSRQLVSPTGY